MPPPDKPLTDDAGHSPQALKPWQQGYRFDTKGKDGAILSGDGAETREAGAPVILNNQASAEEHLPKTTIEEKPAHQEDLNRGFIDPTLRAFTAKFAYLAATNNLTADNQAIQQTFKKSGAVGEQLLAKMAEMEQAGWKVKPVAFTDRYLQLEKPNLLGRLLKMGSLSGYHYDYFKGEQLRTVGYNNVANGLGGILGSNYGTGNPVKHISSIVAHEIAHHDGTLADFKDMSKLTQAEQQTLARRVLATETRSILTQLHVADKVGDMHLTNDALKTALMKRDLGGYIFDAWGKSSSTYSSFGSINRDYAKTFVNGYIDDLSLKTQAKFHSPLVDVKTGRVGVFDLNEGIGNRFGQITGDEELFKRMQSPTVEGALSESRFATFMESKTGKVLGHGMRGLAAVGLIATVADVKSAYGESTAKGNARLARVGVDWAGFEAGTMIGSKLATALVVASKVKVPVAAIPLAAMVAGFGGSYIADKQIGERFETYVGRKPDG